jgi:hypothetical protein
MIARIWRGWTTEENASDYERLLKTEIFPGIAGREIAGYQGIDLFRRQDGKAVEFTTLMWFDSYDAIRIFAGPEYEVAVVPTKARKLLTRFDQRSTHYEVVQSLRAIGDTW